MCADIVDHYTSKVAPLGMKAQVVAFDRALVVAYEQEIRRLISERGLGDEVAVVISVGQGKDEPKEFNPYRLTREQEAKVKQRFNDEDDSLAFLVVTAKLLTGFDAPIEQVMYLDKPLRKHTLFQAITRTNRRYTNPRTGQEKRYGLVVDYIGVAKTAVQAAKLEAEGRLDEAEHLLDPHIGALTQIVTQYAPEGLPVIVEDVVRDIDTIVKQVRYTGWNETQEGDRTVRKQLRVVLKKYNLPVTGPLFDNAYAYISENY